MKLLYYLPLATLLACGSPRNDTSNQAIVEQKVSDDSLKAVIDQMPDVKPAVKAFTDVRKTLSLLSDVGIGHMRSWRSDELGYMSSTPYYKFGAAGANGLRNDLAFYVESPNPNSVRVVKLMLNINNGDASAAARRKYASVATSAMRAFGITVPERLKSALLKGRSVTIKTSTATVSNQHHKDRIEWEKLVIESEVKQTAK
jgi:hypothetical protein